MMRLSAEEKARAIYTIEQFLERKARIEDLAAREIRLRCPACGDETAVPSFEFYERAKADGIRCQVCSDQPILVGNGNDQMAIRMAGALYQMRKGRISEKRIRKAFEDQLTLLRRI